MSILIDENTTFIIQGITGREAVNMARECLDYGSKLVGGVTPGRGGRDVHGVPVFDIRQAAGMTDLLVRDAKLGKALAASLGSKSAVLMRHHGAVVVATSIPNVVGRSVYLDLNARVQIQTMSLSGKFTFVDPAEAKLRMSDPNEYARAWDLWKRQVSR